MLKITFVFLLSFMTQEAAKEQPAPDQPAKVEAAASETAAAAPEQKTDPKPAPAPKPVPPPTPAAEANPTPAPEPTLPPAPAPEPKPEPTSKLNVYPAQITLGSALDRQSIVIQRTLSDGITQDLSDSSTIRIEGPAAKFENGFVLPVADGDAKLIVENEMQLVEIPIKVTGAANVPPVSFQNDVMPVFSKTGCNAGSCHGAARGKDGFNLSLYGFDPKGDHHRLTREMLGRRINLAVPDDCLLTNKATGAVAHSGGSLMSRDSEYYQTITRWLNAGATEDVGKVPTVDKIELYPPAAVLNGPETNQKLAVVATYSDGSTRDVTNLAYFSTNNDNSAKVSQSGVVTAANRGEAFVMARFDTHTVGSDVIVLPKDVQFTWPDSIQPHNYIDERIHDKLRKLRIIPSEVCSDAEFIRRTSLDICGIVPTSEQVQTFVADSDPEKRSKYIDQLLERKEFAEIWLMKWSELLQVRSVNNQVSYKSTLLYFDWLKERISNNVPVDQMVRELLGSTGGTFSNPATNYYEIERDKLKTAENVAQVFMGTRIQCAQCHNHPFDRWTMDDYYSFAAFFAKVNRKQAEDPRERIIFNGGGETKHPVTGKTMQPKFLGGAVPDTKNKDRRVVLAEWLASAENPWFSRNLSNIVWAHFLGRGIVNEVDDVRVSNPAVNPQLLDEMAAKFVDYKFDFKKLVRDICNSRTYQLSTKQNETNASDETNFSRSSLRRIRAEILLDVISQITETRDKFRGLPLGARAVQIADGNTSNYFLNTFGRAKRETVCSCEVIMEPNLSQALHLINGSTVQNKIKQGGVVKKLIDAKKSDDEVLTELYLRCVSRKPTEAELTALKATVAENANRQQALEDVFWALLNSREFVFNH
ncbi:DUF1549 and DUF1553 domain-containing protein [Mariniblastus fucicola]|nr:DUF1549 and DUF1553 domain-containing protein [Mariniblastus fucicola]